MKNKIIDKEHLPLIRKKKQYVEVPLPIEYGTGRLLLHTLVGVLLLPWYLIAAWIMRAPGIALHIKFAFLALRQFFTGRISLRKCFWLICSPMDSTRYFEFPEVLNSLANVPFSRYLDVSSPCLLPLMLLMQNKAATADMVNPDSRDLQETELWAAAFGLKGRCRFINNTIEKVKFEPETFDLVTCISVLEHIPSDKEAVEIMWSLIRPGGHLILTLPCMAKLMEQYFNCNFYGLLSSDANGYTFLQRFYDEERLNEVIFNITGTPIKKVIYGERRYGLFFRNASMRRLLGHLYPFWKQPYIMAKEYNYFKTINELPGDGVVMLEFVKQ